MQLHTVYFICKLLYMFRVVSPPIIRSTNNYLQHLALVNRCCYLSLSWRSWDWFACTRKTVEQDQDGTSCVLNLLASCQQTSMTYTTAVRTVKNSWWLTEELSETCIVLFQK